MSEGANSVIILVAIFMYLISCRYGEIIIIFFQTMETEKVWIKTEEEEEEKAGEVTPIFSEETPCVESVESKTTKLLLLDSLLQEILHII